eukprot:8980798-Pyramimonas_sp.AAC.1
MAMDLLLDKMRSLGVCKAADAFAEKVSKIEVPKDDLKRKAPYPTQCAGVCESTAPAQIKSLQSELFDYFEFYCGPESVGNDTLLCFTVYDGSEVVSTVYALLCEALCRYGRHKASSHYLLYSPSKSPDPVTFADGVLEPIRAAPVAML